MPKDKTRDIKIVLLVADQTGFHAVDFLASWTKETSLKEIAERYQHEMENLEA